MSITRQGIEDGTVLKFGEAEFTFGKDVVELNDSSALISDVQALQDRMARDGYLFLRGFHPRTLVDKAAQRVLDAIAARTDLAPGTDARNGICGPGEKSYSFFRDVAGLITSVGSGPGSTLHSVTRGSASAVSKAMRTVVSVRRPHGYLNRISTIRRAPVWQATRSRRYRPR